jgi:hypothetical protein
MKYILQLYLYAYTLYAAHFAVVCVRKYDVHFVVICVRMCEVYLAVLHMHMCRVYFSVICAKYRSFATFFIFCYDFQMYICVMHYSLLRN